MYFGQQFHSDGTQVLLWAIWDNKDLIPNSEFVFQALPSSPNCVRNCLDCSGPQTDGVHCFTDASLQFGVPYTFSLVMSMQNASGSMWELTMSSPTSSFAHLTFVVRSRRRTPSALTTRFLSRS